MTKQTGLALAGLLVVGLVAPRAQQPAALTALDFYQIHDLNARYSHALDSGQGASFANLFTADGVLVDENGVTTTGRARLSALATAGAGKSATNLSHFYINLAVDAAPGGAIAKVYENVSVPQPGQAFNDLLVGQFWDNLVKTPEGWRFSKRSFLKAGTPRPTTDALALSVPRFSPSPAAGRGLSADDYAAIHQLYHAYGQWWDRPMDGGKGWSELFTADGTFVDAAGKATTGRANLQQLMWVKGAWDIGTHISNILVDPSATADVVNTKAYYIRHTVTQGNYPGVAPIVPDSPSEKFFGLVPPIPGAPNQPAAMLFAQAVRTPAGWRFRNMHLVAPKAPVPAAVAAMLR